MYDASSTAHVRKAEKKAKQLDASDALFLRVSMASVEGRTFFHRLLERCYVFHTPYTGEALSTAFNCGVANIGQQIIADMMIHCPDQYVLMMREATDGRRSSSPGSGSGGDSKDNGRADNDAGDYDPYADSTESDAIDAADVDFFNRTR